MSFWSGKRTQNQSPAEQLESLKRRQIDSLKQNIPSTRIVSEGSLYEVHMRLGTAVLVIHIQLSQQFPQQAPVVFVQPPVQHPLVDPSSMRITRITKLCQWNPHNSLGNIVAEIMKEFTQRPPLLLTNPNYAGHSIPATSGSSSTAAQPKSESSVQNLLPTIPDLFPELDGLEADQLQSLLDDKLVLMSFFNELDYAKTTRALVKDLEKSNVELAQSNLGMEEKVDELNTEIIKLQKEATQSKSVLDVKLEEQNAILAKISPDVLRERLAIAAADAEAKGEQIAEEFLDGDMDVNSFLKEYLKIRRLHHVRMAKRELLL